MVLILMPSMLTIISSSIIMLRLSLLLEMKSDSFLGAAFIGATALHKEKGLVRHAKN